MDSSADAGQRCDLLDVILLFLSLAISYDFSVRFLFHYSPRWIPAALFGMAAPTAVAQYTDPVGYHTMNVPGSSHGLVSILLVNEVAFIGTVSEVTEAGVRFTDPISSSLFGSVGLGFAEVREGSMAGLAIVASGLPFYAYWSRRKRV